MNRDRRTRQLASLFAILVAGLATIATSIPAGLVTFESTGHLWLTGGQAASLNVHVAVDSSPLEGIDLRLTSSVPGDGAPPLVATLFSSAGDVSTDSRPVPADWRLRNPECPIAEPCVRDFRIDIRSTENVAEPLLIPWALDVSMFRVSSYDLVDVTIAPAAPPPSPGLLGLLAGSVTAVLTLLLVAAASWRAKHRRRVLRVSTVTVGILMAVVGAGLWAVSLPSVSGGGLLLAGAAAAVLVVAWRGSDPPSSPRAVLLMISLPLTALLLTVYQIAPAVSPIESVLAHGAIGSALGLAVAEFAWPWWWRSRLVASRDRFVGLIVAGLAVMIAAGALFFASTAVHRDPVPALLMGLAILVLLALREWAQRPTVTVSVIGILIAVIGFGGAFVVERLSGGFFQSVPRPPGPAGPLAFTLTVAVLAALVAVLGRSREEVVEDVRGTNPGQN